MPWQQHSGMQANQQPGVNGMPVRRRWQFRWKLWVVVPLTCLGAAWLLHGVAPSSFDFEEVMDWLNVRDRERYVRLTVLAIVLIGLVGILRVLQGSQDD